MSKSQIRYASSYIGENEIIRDIKIINKEIFIRYYYNHIIPTRYFISQSGQIWSEIIRNFIKPHHVYRSSKDGKRIKTKSLLVHLYIRIDGFGRKISRSPNSLIRDVFNYRGLNIQDLKKK